MSICFFEVFMALEDEGKVAGIGKLMHGALAHG